MTTYAWEADFETSLSAWQYIDWNTCPSLQMPINWHHLFCAWKEAGAMASSEFKIKCNNYHYNKCLKDNPRVNDYLLIKIEQWFSANFLNKFFGRINKHLSGIRFINIIFMFIPRVGFLPVMIIYILIIVLWSTTKISTAWIIFVMYHCSVSCFSNWNLMAKPCLVPFLDAPCHWGLIENLDKPRKLCIDSIN